LAAFQVSTDGRFLVSPEDLETMNVEADRRTLSREDQQRVRELLQHRPLQFCLFLSALLGEKQMEALMISAIRQARQVAAQSEGS